MGDQEGGSFRTPGGEHGGWEPHGCGEGGHSLDILKADLIRDRWVEECER